jgi:hypothetical protein
VLAAAAAAVSQPPEAASREAALRLCWVAASGRHRKQQGAAPKRLWSASRWSLHGGSVMEAREDSAAMG